MMRPEPNGSAQHRRRSTSRRAGADGAPAAVNQFRAYIELRPGRA
jgi:hypothetical protein